MRSKSFFVVAGVLVVLLLAGGGMYAYDSSRDDLIGKNVSVGGVDLSGLRAGTARDKLRAELLDPLNQDVVARHKGRRFTLTAERAQISVDVDASVQAALDRSRSGGLFGRTFRGLTGGATDARLAVDVEYDRQAVSSVVRRVRERLERPAVNADVDISAAGVTARQSKTGLEVDTRTLSRTIRRRLVSATAPRVLKVPASTLKPKVTTAELGAKYPAVIVVDRSSFRLRLYEKLKPTKDYTVAIGAAGYDTPAGLYEIQNMAINPTWSVPNSDWAGSLAGTTVPGGAANNPLKSRWLGIYNGAGIHGTDATYSLGSAASHGCVRMAIPDVEELYDRVDVGTPVYIA